jgi:hypothetical protein
VCPPNDDEFDDNAPPLEPTKRVVPQRVDALALVATLDSNMHRINSALEGIAGLLLK